MASESEVDKLRDYDRLVEKDSKDENFQKLPEVSIAEQVAENNLNFATRFNAGRAGVWGRNRPKWAIALNRLVAWGLLIFIALLVLLFILYLI
ncbi:MAG: hypothetical protein KGH72_02555 [Candidatus Micrarchaeota archaeon]|nr:hypothetical protein [Candidatus Micrarchaeota archaeon]